MKIKFKHYQHVQTIIITELYYMQRKYNEEYDRTIKYLNKMSKQGLINELIQIFDYGPEWIYNDFVKRNLY